MGKLLKFLKPYAGAVAAIICILVVQAYCDLSLPTYTSDIVNVGIQQGGIDETVPDTISKKDLNHLLLLVPSDKQELVKNAYTKSTKKYDYKGTVMELKSSVKEDDHCMDAIRYCVMGAWKRLKYWLPKDETEEIDVCDISRKEVEDDEYL